MKKNYYLKCQRLLALLFAFSIAIVAGVPANAQSLTVKGKVIASEDKLPLPGVGVKIKGSSSGTTTDTEGNFAITSKAGDVLVFSFIGFKEKQVTVGSSNNITVRLETDVAALDEVVVIGYGVQRKKLTTGANLQVKGEDLQNRNQVNPLQALQGQAPGVSISSTSGQPGASMKVVIRGLGTVGNSGPLYVVDGVPGGDISIINPADIQSIDVLKDAASAAIYGSQAANGVVLVTTKKGIAGKSQLTFDAYSGFQNVGANVHLLNADEFKLIMDEQALNSGSAPFNFSAMPDLANTNWMDHMFKDDAKTDNYTLGITGGTDKSLYALSLNYVSQEGIVGGSNISNYERYGFRTNTEHNVISNILKIGQHLNFNYIKNRGINVGNQYNNTLRGAFAVSPLSPVYSDNNKYGNPFNDTSNSPWYNGDGNPYGSMVTNTNNLNDGQRLFADVYADLEPLKGLKFRSLFGFNYSASEYRSFNPLYRFSIYTFNEDHTTTRQNMDKGHTMSWTNTASYDFDINTEHKFSALAGMEAVRYQGTYLSASNWNLLSQFNGFSHAYLDNSTGQAHVDPADPTKIIETRIVNGKPQNLYRRLSFFGRLSYDYKERYLLNATLRADASSKFMKGNQWGYFPSVSAGWIVSSEDFFKTSVNWVNFFKLRASWGQVGNQDISDFQYASPINTSTGFSGSNPAAHYTFGTSNVNVPGAYPNRLSNPDVTWETSEQTNIGFDARLAANRLDLVADFYVKTTKDWLVRPPILATAGAEAPFINGGDVKNTGFELGLGWNDKIGALGYRLGVNGAYNKNEVGRIPTEDGIIHGLTNMLYDNSDEFYRAENGKPIGYFWGYETAGIFQNEQEIAAWKASGKGVLQTAVKPGDVKYVDQQNNGVIDAADKVNLGVGMPNLTYGFNLGLNYKGIDFSVDAYGVAGNKIVQSYRNHANKQANYTTRILDRWTGEGTSNSIPRVTETNVNWQFSDLYLQDGDFLRISNITLGYDFSKLTKRKFANQVRLYVQGQNLFTFTKYDGMDPEIGYGPEGDNGSGWVSGIDLGYYPRPKTVLLGLNVKF